MNSGHSIATKGLEDQENPQNQKSRVLNQKSRVLNLKNQESLKDLINTSNKIKKKLVEMEMNTSLAKSIKNSLLVYMT